MSAISVTCHVYYSTKTLLHFLYLTISNTANTNILLAPLIH